MIARCGFWISFFLFFGATLYGLNMPLSPGWSLEEKVDFTVLIIGAIGMASMHIWEGYENKFKNYRIKK